MYRDPTVNGSKPALKSTDLEQKEEKTFNWNRMKKQNSKKLRRGLGTSRTTLNIPTSES